MKNLILQGAHLLDAQTAPTYDRSKVVTASTMDRCIRQQWYDKHAPANWEPNGFAIRGEYVERFVTDALKAAGQDVRFAGAEQESLIESDSQIAGTPDGYLVQGDEWTLLEVKSFDPRSNTSKFPKSEHITQTQINAALSLIFDRPVTAATLIYVNASDYYDQHPYPIEVPEDPGAFLDSFERRVAKVLRTRNVERLDREGKRDYQCRTCVYKGRCLQDQESAQDGRYKSRRGSKLETAVAAYLAASEEEKSYKDAKAAAGEDIKTELKARKTKSVEVGDHVATLATMPGRRKLNRDGLIEALEDTDVKLSDYESTGKPYEQLSVKVK